MGTKFQKDQAIKRVNIIEKKIVDVLASISSERLDEERQMKVEVRLSNVKKLKAFS